MSSDEPFQMAIYLCLTIFLLFSTSFVHSKMFYTTCKLLTNKQRKRHINKKQERFPVGCVPPAFLVMVGVDLTPPPDADSPDADSPGYRPLSPPPPMQTTIDADPPGCRPPGFRPPSLVTCDACWEANSPPPPPP